MMITLPGKRLYLKNKSLNPVNLVVTTKWYIFNSQFYQQTDGAGMGG